MRRRIILLLSAIVLAIVVSSFWHSDPRPHLAPVDPGQKLQDELAGGIPDLAQRGIPTTVEFDPLELNKKSRHFNCSPGDFAIEAEIVSADDEGVAGRFWEQIDRISDQLLQSSDPEHILMAGLLGSSISKNQFDLQRIQKAVERNPGDARFHWHLLHACEQSAEDGECNSANVERGAISADSGNAALWARIVAQRAKRDDEAGALEAFRFAVAAPGFNSFFVDDLMMFQRGLAATTNQSYGERFSFAMGFLAAMPLVSSDVYYACEPRWSTSNEWRSLCLQFAQRIEQAGQTTLDVMIGLETQMVILKLGNAEEEWQEVNSRYERILGEVRFGWSADVNLVVAVDERVAAEYVNEWAAHGERAASRFLIEETERLKTLPDYDPCVQLEKLDRFSESLRE